MFIVQFLDYNPLCNKCWYEFMREQYFIENVFSAVGIL